MSVPGGRHRELQRAAGRLRMPSSQRAMDRLTAVPLTRGHDPDIRNDIGHRDAGPGPHCGDRRHGQDRPPGGRTPGRDRPRSADRLAYGTTRVRLGGPRRMGAGARGCRCRLRGLPPGSGVPRRGRGGRCPGEARGAVRPPSGGAAVRARRAGRAGRRAGARGGGRGVGGGTGELLRTELLGGVPGRRGAGRGTGAARGPGGGTVRGRR